MDVSNRNEQDMLERFKLKCDLDYLLKKYPKCIKTGYNTLDRRICGGLQSGLIVLGGASSLGKSTFALNLAANISRNGIPVLYYSLEMSAFSIAEKNIYRASCELNEKDSRYAKVTQDMFDRYVRSGKKDESVKQHIDNAAEQSGKDNKNLYIIDYEAVAAIKKTSGRTSLVSADFIIEYTKKAAERFRKQQSTDEANLVVIVDYLQILASNMENDNRTDKQIIDENIRKMWVLAHEINVPVIVISSVNRDAYEKPISLSSFKESGGIEYTADLILGMQFEFFSTEYSGSSKSDILNRVKAEKEKNIREIDIQVLKNRFGPTGKPINFIFESDSSRFVEKDADAQNRKSEKTAEIKSNSRYSKANAAGKTAKKDETKQKRVLEPDVKGKLV